MKIDKHIKTQIQAFQDALQSARDGLKRAGDILCEIVDQEPNAYEMILASVPGITLHSLETLERIGRGKLEPRLITDPSPAAERAIRKAIPMEDQQRLLDRPIDTVTRDNGGFRIEQKRIGEMTQREAHLLIGDDGIRTADEQKQILIAEARRKAESDLRYEIRGDRVTFHGDITLTWSELLEIAEKVKPKAEDIEATIKRRQIAT
jgi:hypothetical protein